MTGGVQTFEFDYTADLKHLQVYIWRPHGKTLTFGAWNMDIFILTILRDGGHISKQIREEDRSLKHTLQNVISINEVFLCRRH